MSESPREDRNSGAGGACVRHGVYEGRTCPKCGRELAQLDRDELGSVVAWLSGENETIPEGCREPWWRSLKRILERIDAGRLS